MAANIECVFEKPAPKKRRASIAHSGDEQDDRVNKIEVELMNLGSVTYVQPSLHTVALRRY